VQPPVVHLRYFFEVAEVAAGESTIMRFTLMTGCACAVLSLVFATAYPAVMAQPMPQSPAESPLSDGSAVMAQPMPQSPAESPLSDGSSKIVAALRLSPDIDRLCGEGDSEAFRDAMRNAVIKLMMSGEIAGNPRKDAESAADYFQAHCGAAQTAQANGVGPSSSSSLP
jgi:hypothetical protein